MPEEVLFLKRYIPFEKLSKKQQRKVNAQKRVTWGELSPVTRKPENSNAYNRAKARSWKYSNAEPLSFTLYPGSVDIADRSWLHAHRHS